MIDHFFIKEGSKQVIIAFAITIFSAIFICTPLALIMLLVTLYLAYIYRVPFRAHNITSDIVSPVDGKLIAIDTLSEEKILYVKLGVCDSHIIVAPENSNYEFISKRNGLNLDSESFKAKKLNSKALIKFDSLSIELTPGSCNTLLSLVEAKEVHQHDRIGVMIEGIVRITLKKDLKPKVKIGQKLRAGESIIA